MPWGTTTIIKTEGMLKKYFVIFRDGLELGEKIFSALISSCSIYIKLGASYLSRQTGNSWNSESESCCSRPRNSPAPNLPLKPELAVLNFVFMYKLKGLFAHFLCHQTCFQVRSVWWWWWWWGSFCDLRTEPGEIFHPFPVLVLRVFRKTGLNWQAGGEAGWDCELDRQTKTRLDMAGDR